MKTNNPHPFPRRLFPLTYIVTYLAFAYLGLGLASCNPNVGGESPGGEPPQIVTLTNITLFPTNVTLGVGMKTNITAQFFPANANINTNIIWVSGDTAVVTVVGGVVTGNSSDTTTITASNASGVTATITVKVLSAPNLSYRGVGCPADTSRLTLTWDSVPGATRYEVFRDKAPTPIATLTSNSYHVSGIGPGDYLFEVKACDGQGCSKSASLTATATATVKTFSNLITTGRIPSDLSGYGVSRDIFSYYPGDATVVPRYVRKDGTGDGSSYANATNSVKGALDGITDASASKVYAVLIAPGTYNAGADMAMKNHVAIIGGQCSLDPAGNIPTVLSGGGTHRVFYNDGITNTALLYGVTITNGYTKDYGGGMANYSSSPILIRVTLSGNAADYGGGMYNFNKSFPILTGVTLSGNTADSQGGGMYNWRSSPVLTEVTLSGNTADRDGGGMNNNENSSPVLTGVTLSGNRASSGGGMYNNANSSPILTGVTLSGNRASSGGGMYNDRSSSPVLTEVTLSGNTVVYSGGGIYNDDSSPVLTGVTLSGNRAQWGGGMANSSSSPVLVGVTLSRNTASYYGGGMANSSSSPLLAGVTLSGNRASTGGGMYNDDSSPVLTGVTLSGNTAGKFGGGMENYSSSLVVVNTILWGNSTEIYGSGSSIHYSIVAGVNNPVDPQLSPLADNGGGILTHAIPASSSAVNVGLYLKRSAAPTGKGCIDDIGISRCDSYILYYSEDKSTWYSDPELTTTVTPPTDAVDLTATDATGRTRSGRPDLGAYEAR